jgi:hypothetical protein
MAARGSRGGPWLSDDDVLASGCCKERGVLFRFVLSFQRDAKSLIRTKVR